MIKSKEVQKKTGVTRSQLRWLDDKKIIIPEKVEGDGINKKGKKPIIEWQYSEEQLKRIEFMQIFHEVGYRGERLKKIMQGNIKEYKEAISKGIEILEEKMVRYERMIRILRSFEIVNELPYSTLEAFYEYYAQKNRENTWFYKVNEYLINGTGDEDIPEDYSYVYMQILIYHMLAIGFSQKYSSNDRKVKKRIDNMFKYYIDTTIEIKKAIGQEEIGEYFENNRSNPKVQCEMFEMMKKDTLGDEYIVKMVEKECQPGVIDFIKEAFEVYDNNLLKQANRVLANREK